MDDNQTDTFPYKVLKMNSGEDVICKILKEFSDALVIERPMSIAESTQFNEELGEVVNQTGLQRWLNFTNDTEFVVAKDRVLTVANLAPEVTYYYKHLVEKLVQHEQHQPKDEEEVSKKMKEIRNNLSEVMEGMNPSDDESNVLPFKPMDKSKLH